MTKSKQLSLQTLWSAAPEACSEFETLLRAAFLDCKNRPACSKSRRVVLTLMVTPSQADPEDVLVEPVITTRTPVRDYVPFRGRISKTSQLIFDFPESESDEAA